MIEECARPGKLQSTIQQTWLPLFTPPPPPTYIPKDEFAKEMGKAIEQRFHDVAAVVQKLRARGGKLVDVGPRSAHIAGLPYAAFAKPEDIIDPTIEFFQPKADDPDDYIAVRSANGTRYAITNTCAANVLGYAKPGLHAHGNLESARRAIAVLAEFIGKSIEDTARALVAAAKA